MKFPKPLVILCAAAALSCGQAKAPRQPVIDVHLHSESVANLKDWRPNPVTGKKAPESIEEHIKQTLAERDRYNIVLGIAIDWIEQADFLTDKQKRDILYNNAARFLRLTPEQIAEHHESR